MFQRVLHSSAQHPLAYTYIANSNLRAAVSCQQCLQHVRGSVEEDREKEARDKESKGMNTAHHLHRHTNSPSVGSQMNPFNLGVLQVTNETQAQSLLA